MARNIDRTASIPQVKDGVYSATIDGFEHFPEAEYLGKPKPQVKWLFTLSTGDVVSAYTSYSNFQGRAQLSSSKPNKWLKAIGRPIEGDILEESDFVDLKGLNVDVLVGHNNAGWPRVEQILGITQTSEQVQDALEALKGISINEDDGWASDTHQA